MALGRILVVDRKVGHGKTMRNPRHSLDDPSYFMPMELISKLVDRLGRRRSVDLRKGEVELAAHIGQVVMRRIRLVGDEGARVNSSGGDEFIGQAG